MQLINWLALQPLLEDVDRLNASLQESHPARDVCRFLADITLGGYPWRGRSDLIPCYHPARTYRPGQWIALPVMDPQQVHPTAWQVARVKSAESTGNSVQGRFQALVLDVDGRELRRTAGIAGADYPELGLSCWSHDQLHWLAGWVADTYAGALLATLRKLIQKGRVSGKVAGETFLPERMFALSLDRLEPSFARLAPPRHWVSSEEILQGQPDLTCLKHETALALIRSTLEVSPYRSLGGERWTTPELFDQMDRVVPYGLPAAYQGSLWTGQDKKDMAACKRKPIPAEALKELEKGTGDSDGNLHLPPLSYYHVTQACFTVGHLLDAFAPDLRMVFVQWMDGDHQPFLLDRDQGLLKAVHPEALQTRILDEGVPAGTHLWLEYQGGERFRLSPRLLASPCLVPCKRASRRDGKLHIEPSQIQMKYEGEAALFQADMQLDDLQALHARAKEASLSLREALIAAIRELCAAGPRKVAGRADILNAVYLQRPCSPQAAAALLYSLPCFEQLEGDRFGYVPQPPYMRIHWKTDRLACLWDDLVANFVLPDPASAEGTSPWLDSQPGWLFSPAPVPGPELTSSLKSAEMQGETSPGSHTGGSGEHTLLERDDFEPVQLIQKAVDVGTVPPGEAPLAAYARDSDPELHPLSQEEMEREPIHPLRVETSYTPFPAMIKVSMEPELPASTIDTRRIAHGLKIPAKPLHKRPIHQRLFFCLRGLVHKSNGRS